MERRTYIVRDPLAHGKWHIAPWGTCLCWAFYGPHAHMYWTGSGRADVAQVTREKLEELGEAVCKKCRRSAAPLEAKGEYLFRPYNDREP